MQETTDVTANGEDKRKCNLVFYNVPESTSTEASKRIEEDIIFCKNIIEKELNIFEYSMKHIMRLGKKQEDDNIRPRPVLIKLNSEKEKWLILGKAKNLRNSIQFKETCMVNVILIRLTESS